MGSGTGVFSVLPVMLAVARQGFPAPCWVVSPPHVPSICKGRDGAGSRCSQPDPGWGVFYSWAPPSPPRPHPDVWMHASLLPLGPGRCMTSIEAIASATVWHVRVLAPSETPAVGFGWPAGLCLFIGEVESMKPRPCTPPPSPGPHPLFPPVPPFVKVTGPLCSQGPEAGLGRGLWRDRCHLGGGVCVCFPCLGGGQGHRQPEDLLTCPCHPEDFCVFTPTQEGPRREKPWGTCFDPRTSEAPRTTWVREKGLGSQPGDSPREWERCCVVDGSVAKELVHLPGRADLPVD